MRRALAVLPFAVVLSCSASTDYDREVVKQYIIHRAGDPKYVEFVSLESDDGKISASNVEYWKTRPADRRAGSWQNIPPDSTVIRCRYLGYNEKPSKELNDELFIVTDHQVRSFTVNHAGDDWFNRLQVSQLATKPQE